MKDASTVERAIPRGFMLIDARTSPSITSRLPRDYSTWVLLSSGMCSCALYERPMEREPAEGRSERLRSKYRKLGWSQAKIARALGQATHRPQAGTAPPGLRADVRKILADLAESISELAVVCHYYHEELTTEKFDISVGPTVTPAAFRRGEPPLAEDVILAVNAPPLLATQ